jgi:hypothetical protein
MELQVKKEHKEQLVLVHKVQQVRPKEQLVLKAHLVLRALVEHKVPLEQVAHKAQLDQLVRRVLLVRKV